MTDYLVHCIDCGKPLRSTGQPPANPICLHCDIIRAAPEATRERIRLTLQPIPVEAGDSASVGADAEKVAVTIRGESLHATTDVPASAL